MAASALEQRVGFLSAVTAKVLVKQVDHGPQVTALFNVDLEQIAQIIHTWRSQTKMALLLH